MGMYTYTCIYAWTHKRESWNWLLTQTLTQEGVRILFFLFYPKPISFCVHVSHLLHIWWPCDGFSLSRWLSHIPASLFGTLHFPSTQLQLGSELFFIWVSARIGGIAGWSWTHKGVESVSPAVYLRSSQSTLWVCSSARSKDVGMLSVVRRADSKDIC